MFFIQFNKSPSTTDWFLKIKKKKLRNKKDEEKKTKQNVQVPKKQVNPKKQDERLTLGTFEVKKAIDLLDKDKEQEIIGVPTKLSKDCTNLSLKELLKSFSPMHEYSTNFVKGASCLVSNIRDVEWKIHKRGEEK